MATRMSSWPVRICGQSSAGGYGVWFDPIMLALQGRGASDAANQALRTAALDSGAPQLDVSAVDVACRVWQ